MSYVLSIKCCKCHSQKNLSRYLHSVFYICELCRLKELKKLIVRYKHLYENEEDYNKELKEITARISELESDTL